jgi:hypothetical protein
MHGCSCDEHPSIQWRNSPEPGQGLLIVRFLDHVAGLLRQVISPSQSGQATAFHKFLTISDSPTSPLAIRPAETPSSEAGDWR